MRLVVLSVILVVLSVGTYVGGAFMGWWPGPFNEPTQELNWEVEYVDLEAYVNE